MKIGDTIIIKVKLDEIIKTANGVGYRVRSLNDGFYSMVVDEKDALNTNGIKVGVEHE